jgi:hypothetical protein
MTATDTSFRKVPAGCGVAWISGGFDLFKRAPGLWIGILVLWFVALGLASLIPFIGSVAINLSFPIVLGGLLLGARAQASGQALTLETLWAGFLPPHQQPLLLLGVAYMVIGIVIAVVAGGLIFATAGAGYLAGDADIARLGFGGLLSLLVILVLLGVFSMATWFAPALVVFAGKEPIAALKLSFAATLGNLGAFAVYGLLSLLMLFVAAIPFGLGLLVAVPVLVASVYRSYADIFGVEDSLGLP